MNLKSTTEQDLDAFVNALNALYAKHNLEFEKIKISKVKASKKRCKYVKEYYTYKGKKKVRIVKKC